jgi:hypothetical protein
LVHGAGDVLGELVVAHGGVHAQVGPDGHAVDVEGGDARGRHDVEVLADGGELLDDGFEGDEFTRAGGARVEDVVAREGEPDEVLLLSGELDSRGGDGGGVARCDMLGGRGGWSWFGIVSWRRAR